jgi:NADH-quinone oxidoreductase subunit L
MFKASLFMGAGAVLHAVGSRFMTDMGGVRGKMKKTFLFMMMAGLSLAAAPFITSGFWSKDAIIASVLESGYQYSWALFAIAIMVSFMTAFYTFRMLGMTFFGNKSKFIEENESTHHVHEVGAVMWIPFAILAVASIAVGLIGFAFEHQLHEMFSLYLENSFGIHTAHDVLPQASSGFGAFEGLNPIAVTASVGAFALGALLGGLVYMKKVISPEIVSKSIVSRAIWKFFYNRWYLNTALYWGAVIGPLAIYRIVWRYFESTIIDGINPGLQGTMTYFSKVIKAGQTGIAQTYLFVFAAGMMIIIMLLFL